MTAIKVTHSGDNNPQLRINTGNQTQRDAKESGKDKKTVSAAGLNLSDPTLAERKANAKKQAMNVVTQAFGKEQKIDEAAKNVEGDIARRLNAIPDLEEKNKDADAFLEELRSKHGVKKGDETDDELMRLAYQIYDGKKSGESGSAWVRREQELWNQVYNHESAYVREGIHEAITLIESTDDIYTNKGVIKLEHQALSDLDRERLADTSMRDALEKAKIPCSCYVDEFLVQQVYDEVHRRQQSYVDGNIGIVGSVEFGEFLNHVSYPGLDVPFS